MEGLILKYRCETLTADLLLSLPAERVAVTAGGPPERLQVL